MNKMQKIKKKKVTFIGHNRVPHGNWNFFKTKILQALNFTVSNVVDKAQNWSCSEDCIQWRGQLYTL